MKIAIVTLMEGGNCRALVGRWFCNVLSPAAADRKVRWEAWPLNLVAACNSVTFLTVPATGGFDWDRYGGREDAEVVGLEQTV